MKSEKLQLYCTSLNNHKNMINYTEERFFHEVKSILTLNSKTINKLVLKYSDDFLYIRLFYKVDPTVKALIIMNNEELSKEPISNEDDMLILVGTINLETEVMETCNKDECKNFLADLKKLIDSSLEENIKVKLFIQEKRNKLLFRLFHPFTKNKLIQIEKQIENLNGYSKILDEEKNIFEGNNLDSILKTFKDEFQANFGIKFVVKKGEI